MAFEYINYDIHRPLCWICAVIVLCTFLAQRIVIGGWGPEQRRRYSHNKLFMRTLLAIYVVLLAQAVSHIARSFALPTCSSCHAWAMFGGIIYVLAQMLIYWFLVQRAQMSQALLVTPIASKRCFKYYFPAVMLLIWVFATIGVIRQNARSNMDIACVDFCQYDIRKSAGSVTPVLGAVVGLIFTVVVLYLFVKPFARIYRNAQQSRTVQLEMEWNMACSAVSLVTSNVVSLAYHFVSHKFLYLWPVDIALNAITSFLFLRRNRQWLAFQCWHRCKAPEQLPSRTQTVEQPDAEQVAHDPNATPSPDKLSQINEMSAEVMPTSKKSVLSLQMTEPIADQKERQALRDNHLLTLRLASHHLTLVQKSDTQ